jgi:hypothetical protein
MAIVYSAESNSSKIEVNRWIGEIKMTPEIIEKYEIKATGTKGKIRVNKTNVETAGFKTIAEFNTISVRQITLRSAI